MLAEDVKQAYSLAKYKPTVYQVKFYAIIPEKSKPQIGKNALPKKVMVLCMN